jgi:hypothetical protein
MRRHSGSKSRHQRLWQVGLLCAAALTLFGCSLLLARAAARSLHHSKRFSNQQLSHAAAAVLQPALSSVHWYAPFLDHNSFGVEAQSLVLGLVRHGLVEANQIHISLLQLGEKQQFCLDADDPIMHSRIVNPCVLGDWQGGGGGGPYAHPP